MYIEIKIFYWEEPIIIVGALSLAPSGSSLQPLFAIIPRFSASYLLELYLFYFRNHLRLVLSVENIVGERIRGNKSSVLDLGKVEEVVAAVGEGDVAVAVEEDQEEGEEKTDNWDWEEEYLQIFWFPFLY